MVPQSGMGEGTLTRVLGSKNKELDTYPAAIKSHIFDFRICICVISEFKGAIDELMSIYSGTLGLFGCGKRFNKASSQVPSSHAEVACRGI